MLLEALGCFGICRGITLLGQKTWLKSETAHENSLALLVNTAISKNVVGKKCAVTTQKGNMGYDQYTVSDADAV